MNNTTIWKFTIGNAQSGICASQTVPMPEGAEILTAQMQGDVLCLWVIVDPSANLQRREIEVFGTGHPVVPEAKRRYIGTVQMHGGSLIWHVFEREQIYDANNAN